MSSHFTVCFHHPDFIVIDKPEGVSVHKDNEASGLTERIAQQLGVPQIWLVHRLDKATSGLLILALTKEAAVEFYHLFKQHKIQKTYWALSTTKPKKKQGKIIGDMKKSRNSAWKLCHTKENPAITQFTSQSVAPQLRWFTLHPHTGRTHQLRVAMKSLGSPILDDSLYGGEFVFRVYFDGYQFVFEYKNTHFCIQTPPTSGLIWQKIYQNTL